MTLDLTKHVDAMTRTTLHQFGPASRQVLIFQLRPQQLAGSVAEPAPLSSKEMSLHAISSPSRISLD